MEINTAYQRESEVPPQESRRRVQVARVCLLPLSLLTLYLCVDASFIQSNPQLFSSAATARYFSYLCVTALLPE